MNENEYQPIEGLHFRLDGKQWCLVAAISLVILCYGPSLWSSCELLDGNDDYRVPYELSQDYFLYQRHVTRSTADSDSVFVLGDSVVWGEYVQRDGTWSHFLNQQSDGSEQFVNVGLNGLFPLALEGLTREYGSKLRRKRVILHCNLLWISSPEADLSVEKEQVFNHVSLVPQFVVDIPCYRASASDRASVIAERSLPNLSWSKHLQICYFDSKSIPDWTLADDGRYPPSYPHSNANPLEQITMDIPREDPLDTQRGLQSERHRSWSDRGIRQQSFPWLRLQDSLQWAAFQRLVWLLQDRQNDVAVVVGPFNQHMLSATNREVFQTRKKAAIAWLEQQDVEVFAPSLLGITVGILCS